MRMFNAVLEAHIDALSDHPVLVQAPHNSRASVVMLDMKAENSGQFSQSFIDVNIALCRWGLFNLLKEAIIVGETAVFCLQLATRDFENQEKTILTGDCCYINPLVRRTVRFLGIYTFGLFATDIFVNAGQVVTGNLAPHFLALCKPNYTALGCQQYTQFISGEEACTGNPDLIMRARKTFPSKEAALSVYAAMYLTMYITNTIKAKGTRLAKPVLCLGLMCLAFLTGLNRVAEYRNHWSDVIAGFLVGISIAVFLVVCVVNNFKGRQPESEHIHMDNLAQMPMISIPRVERPLEKVTYLQVIPSLNSKMSLLSRAN
ncbi:Lipid phosphate phosphatase-related protein type 5 [Fukomys damarensis]|uniref:Phospholipid phosphatase-related protein type 5 n=1 Tax=Fukomys damarensis TaxID=885580 RepID=A0A091DUR9_FUKDA|nr:Lipid phosphate phosphatase-related protein type 5 [Fukomys damarensis]